MNNRFALTISPPDRVVNYVLNKVKNPLRAVYDDDLVIIRKALNRCSTDYLIYPELDITGRLHYHGIVTINNMTNWKSTSSVQLKTIGYINIKPNPSEGWDRYITKEWDQTKSILHLMEPIRYEPLKRGPKVKVVHHPCECHSAKQTIMDYFY